MEITFEMVSSLIGTLGFPVVACLGLFWFLNKQEERRTEEIHQLQTTLAENTAILSSLKELIQVLINGEE